MNNFYVAVDFDGTIAEHAGNRYPEIGRVIQGAFWWMDYYRKMGMTIILLTMRSGNELGMAVDFCRQHGFEFDLINENPQNWTNSPKIYAHQYIDDLAAGTPLAGVEGGRKYVDWAIVGPLVVDTYREWKRKGGW